MQFFSGPVEKMVNPYFITIPLLDFKQFDVLLKDIPPLLLFPIFIIFLILFLEFVPFFIKFFFFSLGWLTGPINQVESVLTTAASVNGFTFEAVQCFAGMAMLIRPQNQSHFAF